VAISAGYLKRAANDSDMIGAKEGWLSGCVNIANESGVMAQYGENISALMALISKESRERKR